MERAAYRIIDANFNRAREALRVIEDYCRFVLNCAPLSARTKDLRHRLCSAIAGLRAEQLIVSRDTPGDVGIGQTTKNTIKRANLEDSLTAACKRLPEALRVLAETIKSEKTDIAEKIEQLRYAGYTLEKDVSLFAGTHKRFSRVGLYVLICSNLPADVFALAEKCIAGGVDCLQLRPKDIKDDKYFALAAEFVSICKDAGVISIINDRVDIALAAGADGVHLGQNDLPLQQARKLQLSPLIIGKSTHSIEQLNVAVTELPAYVSLGPVFATATKPDAQPVGIDYIKKALPVLSDTAIQHVAIGGINEDNVNDILKAGAKTIAVSSTVTDSPNPTVACKKLKEKIEAFSSKK